MGALRYKQAKTSNEPWEPAKQAIPDADSHADAYAYQDTERNSYKLPHHFLNQDGSVGEASTKACQQAIAYLNSEDARKAMSDEDITAAYNHLAAHLRDAKQEAPQLNGIEQSGSHTERISIDANALEDDENGTLTFPGGQVIMDGSDLRSGLSYDMETLDYSEFNGTVTVDHDRRIQSVVAKTKMYMRGDELTIDSLQFAIGTSALAILAYDLYRNGFAKDLSIETYGPWPNEDGKFNKAKVIGLSLVVVGNSKAARMNSEMQQIVANSLAQAKANNLDIADLEQELGVKAKQSVTNNHKEDTVKTVKNSQTFAVTVKYKNAAGDEAENSLAAGATIDVAEDQAEAVENQIKNAVDPANAPLTANDLSKALEDRDAKHAQELEELKKAIAANSAVEPEFKPLSTSRQIRNKVDDKELAAMDWEERTVNQIESARLFLTNNDLEGLQQLNRINKFHASELREKGLIKNAVDMSAFGNFVTSPELLTEIEGHRSDYAPLVEKGNYKETTSLEMAWLERNGDIEMEEVGMENAGDDENLKPLSEYSATPQSAKLKEIAAVTPVSNAATRFLAVDLLSDVAEGYRTSYQRKLAQLMIARFQQAINATGNTTAMDWSGAQAGMIGLIRTIKKIANVSPNGTFLMNVSTELELFELQMAANLNGDTLGLFQKGPNGMTFAGRSYMTVPDDVLPTLNTNETRTFQVDGANVTVDQAIVYGDLSTYSGRVSGGLNYTLSTEAAYETADGVKSSFQRDELLLRGYGFRNGAVRNRAKIAGVRAESGTILS